MENKINLLRQRRILLYAFSISIIIALTFIDWAVVNVGYIAQGVEPYIFTSWMFEFYFLSMFSIFVAIVVLFLIFIEISNLRGKLKEEGKTFKKFGIYRYIIQNKKYAIFIPGICFLILILFGIEDIFIFRIFYEPPYSEVINDFFGRMIWLDGNLAGYFGLMLGFEGATTLSLIICSIVGYSLFSLLWYYLIKDKFLFLNLGIFILFAFNIDYTIMVLEPPIPFLRISICGIGYLISLILISIRNY